MKCPFCKEDIADGAIKCKHCGSILDANAKVLRYQTYQQVPWYRKNWFAILSGIFFPPALFLTLISGEIYYVRKNELRSYSGLAKFFLILLCLPAVGLLVLVAGGTLLIGGAALSVARNSVQYYEKHPDKIEATVRKCQESHQAEMLGIVMVLPTNPSADALRRAGLPSECANAIVASLKINQAREQQSTASNVAPSNQTKSAEKPAAEAIANVEQVDRLRPDATQTSPGAPTAATSAPTENRVAWTPSFDCTKASTFAEKAVCSDARLGQLDGILAQNYKYMLAADIGEGGKGDLKKTQQQWLAERNNCTDNSCLIARYSSRIAQVCEYPVISGVHPRCTGVDAAK